MLNPIDILYFKMAVGQDRIKAETPTDISARCPICGDSKYSKNKARLHLYERDGKTFVNCFNECSCVNKTVFSFLRNYYPSLYDSYKREIFKDQLKTVIDDYSSDINKLDKSIKKSLSSVFDTSESIETLSIKPEILFKLNCFADEPNTVSEYFKNRGLRYKPEIFGKCFISKTKITIDDKNFPLVNYIIIPLYCNDSWYGFYSRSLTEHKFFTYIPAKNVGFKVWNLYNVDVNKSVYIFEGIFDALSAYQAGITNVVACCGATIPDNILKSFKDAVFCLDNDRTGIVNSLKYLKNGYKVVDWQNTCKDCNEMLNAGIDLKSEILNNTVSGILGIVKMQTKM